VSKLWVKVNYQAAASLIKGMRGFANGLERLLDKAFEDTHGEEVPCRRNGDRRSNGTSDTE